MKRFGLLGKTLKHSFSQDYFSKKFQSLGITDCVYENFELPSADELPALLKKYPDLTGLNVTIPYKQDVLPYLDECSDEVKAIGACNCIKIANGKLSGFNADAIGFAGSLLPHVKSHHSQALVLGSGGASKAVQYVLQQHGITYQIVSTSGKGALTYDELTREIMESHLIIINTTPLGMYPVVNTAPAIPYSFITEKHLLYDLTYNPEKTLFLQEGEKRGASIINGFQMLILQAEESWRIWNL